MDPMSISSLIQPTLILIIYQNLINTKELIIYRHCNVCPHCTHLTIYYFIFSEILLIINLLLVCQEIMRDGQESGDVDATTKLREIKKKTVLFDTQMSHDSHVEDKEFSPWVKKRGMEIIKRVELGPEDKKKVSLEFLAAIKKTLKKSPEPQQNYLRQKTPKVLMNTLEVCPRKSQTSFQQIFKRAKNQQNSLLRKRYNRAINQINLKLDCDSCFRTTPYKSEQHRALVTRQFLNRQTKRNLTPHQRKFPQTSESNRYNIVKAQQIICKTIELNLPLQKNKRIIQSRMQRQKGQTLNMSFPLRTSPFHSKILNSQKEQRSKDCNIMGESIQLNLNQKTRSRREKLREHYQHESLHSDTKIFLESYK